MRRYLTRSNSLAEEIFIFTNLFLTPDLFSNALFKTNFVVSNVILEDFIHLKLSMLWELNQLLVGSVKKLSNYHALLFSPLPPQ